MKRTYFVTFFWSKNSEFGCGNAKVIRDEKIKTWEDIEWVKNNIYWRQNDEDINITILSYKLIKNS